MVKVIVVSLLISSTGWGAAVNSKRDLLLKRELVLKELKHIAYDDPDAFDADRGNDEGWYPYMCGAGVEYSKKLNRVCLAARNAGLK